MGLYNFQPRFEQFIRDGRKCHTIRALRANAEQSGNICHLYVGLQTKKCRLIFRAPCVGVDVIQITEHGLICVNEQWLSSDEKEAFAKRDGFRNFEEMFRFWQVPVYRLPFEGHVIHWDFTRRFTDFPAHKKRRK